MPVMHDLRVLGGDVNFDIYTAGNIATQLSYWMLRTVSGWHAWALTGQSSWVGVVVAADMLPALLIGPWAGVLADRIEVRRVLLACYGAATALFCVMALLAGQDALRIWVLTGMMAANGIVTGFVQPAAHAAITGVCARPQLGTAISLHSILFNVARFIGPAIAGVLIAMSGVALAFWVTAALMALSWLGFALVRFAPLDRMTSSGSVLAETWSAFRFVATAPGSGPIFALFVAAAFLLRPIGELLPELADVTLSGDAETLARLSSAMGLGAIIAGFANMLGGVGGLVRLSYAGAGVAVVGGIGLAMSQTATAAIAFSVLYGAAIAAGGVSAQTVMQVSAPANMRGRIMSLFGMTFRAGPAIGAMAMGVLADRLGLAPVSVAGCIGMLVIVALLARHYGTARDSMKAV